MVAADRRAPTNLSLSQSILGRGVLGFRPRRRLVVLVRTPERTGHPQRLPSQRHEQQEPRDCQPERRYPLPGADRRVDARRPPGVDGGDPLAGHERAAAASVQVHTSPLPAAAVRTERAPPRTLLVAGVLGTAQVLGDERTGHPVSPGRPQRRSEVRRREQQEHHSGRGGEQHRPGRSVADGHGWAYAAAAVIRRYSLRRPSPHARSRAPIGSRSPRKPRPARKSRSQKKSRCRPEESRCPGKSRCPGISQCVRRNASEVEKSCVLKGILCPDISPCRGRGSRRALRFLPRTTTAEK